MIRVHYTYRRLPTADGSIHVALEEHAPDQRPAPDGSTFFTVYPEDGGYGSDCNRCGGYVGWQDTREEVAQFMWKHDPVTCFDYLYSEGTEEMQLLGVVADFSDMAKRTNPEAQLHMVEGTLR